MDDTVHGSEILLKKPPAKTAKTLFCFHGHFNYQTPQLRWVFFFVAENLVKPPSTHDVTRSHRWFCRSLRSQLHHLHGLEHLKVDFLGAKKPLGGKERLIPKNHPGFDERLVHLQPSPVWKEWKRIFQPNLQGIMFRPLIFRGVGMFESMMMKSSHWR